MTRWAQLVEHTQRGKEGSLEVHPHHVGLRVSTICCAIKGWNIPGSSQCANFADMFCALFQPETNVQKRKKFNIQYLQDPGMFIIYLKETTIFKMAKSFQGKFCASKRTEGVLTNCQLWQENLTSSRQIIIVIPKPELRVFGGEIPYSTTIWGWPTGGLVAIICRICLMSLLEYCFFPHDYHLSWPFF